MSGEPVNIYWFRRDLRIEDNHGLSRALKAGLPVLPIFIFDSSILDHLSEDDARVSFIHNTLKEINDSFIQAESSLLVKIGEPLQVFKQLSSAFNISAVYFNEDYEPYAKERDNLIAAFLQSKGIAFHGFKDHLVFAPGEILKDDGDPYTVYTPFMKRWKKEFSPIVARSFKVNISNENLIQRIFPFPGLEETGFSKSKITVPPYSLDRQLVSSYGKARNRPDWQGTTNLSTHLRFGTVSVRKAISVALQYSETLLNELIWREFFGHILYFYPHSATQNFRNGFNLFPWENDPEKIGRWMNGTTGYPLVDAGMRELVKTGLMHNRVRMVTASFLVKDLLVEWRIGEAFFAKHLLDFEQASNVGNWQWAAGTGCDAAPFFRIFNPEEQQKRFDPDFRYIRRWVPEYGTSGYPHPMITHADARVRALTLWKGLSGARHT
jgi:deoxyribodipyrimidine photo-lyase